jgi:hypothetical protein
MHVFDGCDEGSQVGIDVPREFVVFGCCGRNYAAITRLTVL